MEEARNGCCMAVVQWILLDLMHLQRSHALSHVMLCTESW